MLCPLITTKYIGLAMCALSTNYNKVLRVSLPFTLCLPDCTMKYVSGAQVQLRNYVFEIIFLRSEVKGMKEQAKCVKKCWGSKRRMA